MGLGSSLPEVHSVEVADAEKKPGEGVPRRLTAAPLPTCGKKGPEVDSLYKSFAHTAKQFPDNDCMGKRIKNADGSLGPFEFISYSAAHKQALLIGSGIATLKGLGSTDCFGMYAANSIEWSLVALGAWSRGMTNVPVYDTLGDNIVQYECNHADIKIMFVDASKLKAVANVVAACKTLKYVVQIQPLGSAEKIELAPTFAAAGVQLLDLDAIKAAGASAPAEPTPSGGDSLAVIMYTSGTTGDPKGVCLTQMSIVIGSSYCGGLSLFPTDKYLSYLPLAHIFETMVEHSMWSVGAAVGYYAGNIKTVNEDIVALRPTVFVGVPRVYQRFYEQAYAKINAMKPAIKNVLLHALEVQTAAVKQGTSAGLWGTLLAKLLGAKLHGGQVRLMISGAAPLPTHVQEFLLAACGCQVVQGYGMTENCANATLALPADWRAGHVGPPFPTTEVKLVDVPEMNYTTAGNSSGEVCVKGPVVFAGYHKNQEETDKVLEPDGWLHTGDIGRWNADGTLSIIDRKKNIFKLAQGEYVAAEKIEMALSKSKYISQPWVYGNSFFPQLVAVIVPDFTQLVPAAKEGGWYVDDLTALAKKPEAVALIMGEVKAEAKAAALKSFEVPKQILLEGTINELAQGFSIANDCLTPTFKLKRPQLLKKYQADIDAMYVALGEDPSKFK